MRLDPEHVRKLARARAPAADGTPEVKFDVDYMSTAMTRLTMWERGLLLDAVMRASRARRPTMTQRALLALFVHGSTETDEGAP